ncbi:hypothetical protein QYE76_063773 [Lolium multiflorum]|uniref:Uncharacterized protein n=1 Tax=Lolium multiflorum TaxID=4521 RepID=A0AAD8S6D5_LOLMU|nr:hypothetical protein QYE76_063773 [Lolium multiflorum]
MGDEREQYFMLTKIFVESFKFDNKHYRPTVAFKIYGNPITMKLEEFCVALGIAPVGTTRRIEDNPRALLELYREITNDDCRTIQRGKIRNIQLPAIKYFAYYIATSILGRENTSNISSYHLAFLIAALTGETPYHLGSLIARRLSNKGPIFGGIIASRILAHLELPLDSTDVPLTPIRLDIAAMKSHQFVTADSSSDNLVYRILFADVDEREIPLPQPDLFSIDRKPWSRSKEEVEEKMKIQGFHQQHDSEDAEPSYDYTVTYPGASSSTYPEYDPSSSYYGEFFASVLSAALRLPPLVRARRPANSRLRSAGLRCAEILSSDSAEPAAFAFPQALLRLAADGLPRRSQARRFSSELLPSQLRRPSEESLPAATSSTQDSNASGGLTDDAARMGQTSSRKQETGTSSRASGKDKTRGAWRGSDVTQYEIDWLYRSRRIPEGVTCRLPRGEIQPVLEPGETVVFLAHFERGFGLPASDFFRQFLDFYRLQPHHLPGNAVFYLSCFVAFMEGYIGIRPARETFARFFSLRINSVQGKDIPAPKPPVQCGSCIIGSRQGSPFFKFNGLESCRLWQTTFFYVRNAGDEDLINLPAFNPAPPAKTNWQYNPGRDHAETNRVVRFMQRLMKDTDICSDDIIRTFISRRVLPLQRRAHKISEMYGPGDPTKITGLALSKEDVVLKASQICQTDMPDDWEWGLCPLSARNPPSEDAKARFPRIDSDRRGPCRKRPLDKYDPDPVIHWLDLRMGRTPASRLGKSPPEPADLPSASNKPQVHEHVPPLQAEVGDEFLGKLMAEGQKSDPPAADAGPSHASSGKRPRTEVIGGKQVGTKRYKQKRMPMSSGPALELGSAGSAGSTGSKDFNSSSSLKSGTIWCRQHLCLPFGRHYKFGARGPNTSRSPRGGGLHLPSRDPRHRRQQHRRGQTGRAAEPLVPPPPKKKKKKQASSSPTAPDASAPVPSPPKATPTPPPSQGPSAAKQPAPSGTPKITTFLKPGASRGKAVEGGASGASGDVVLHVGPAARCTRQAHRPPGPDC